MALGLLLIAGFDIAGPPLAFNDDWIYAWNVAHFPRLLPAGSALGYPQDAMAAALLFGHFDRRLLRLTAFPFAALSALLVHLLARRCGADRTWSAMAAVSLVACPVFAATATTFMTDVPYLALELASLLAAIRWLRWERSPVPFLVLTLLATLQRQSGAALPVVVLVAMLLAGRRRPGELTWAAGAAALSVLAVAALTLTPLAPPTEANLMRGLSGSHPLFAVLALMFLPGMVGLGMAPMLPALLRQGATARRSLAPYAVALVAWELFVFWIAARDIFPGNVFTPRSLNWTWRPGPKPEIYPAVVFLAVEALSVAAVATLVLRLRRALGGDRLTTLVLVLAAASQFAPLLVLNYQVFDRYFLPVMAPLLPLAARAATGASARRALAGLALAAGLLVMYAVGEQDYLAWQTARDRAAQLAYRSASPYEVDAGYEANAVYGEIPAYDLRGESLSDAADVTAPDFALQGPPRPKLRLVIEPASAPGEGVSYWSLAPGKVVIEPVPPP